jgi:hypothetical protein
MRTSQSRIVDVVLLKTTSTVVTWCSIYFPKLAVCSTMHAEVMRTFVLSASKHDDVIEQQGQ